MSQVHRIGITELRRRVESGDPCLIIDVRSPEEYRSLHARGAVSLPLGKVDHEAMEACLSACGATEQTRLFFICHSGRRAVEACERMLEHYPDAAVIEGGTLAWAQAGLAVTQGEKP